MILKNLTNSPQMVGPHRIPARGQSEPIELDARMLLAVKSSGIFTILAGDSAPTQEGPPPPPTDAFDAMSDDDLRELYEVVKGKAPHHKTGRAKLLEAVRADES